MKSDTGKIMHILCTAYSPCLRGTICPSKTATWWLEAISESIATSFRIACCKPCQSFGVVQSLQDPIGQGSDVLVVFVQPRRGLQVAAGRRTPVFWSSIVIEAPFGQRGQ